MASKKKFSEKTTKRGASKKGGLVTQPVQSLAFPIVGIGASAGGLEAFRQVLEHLPTDTGMAFILVQHLDPKHESILAELLSRATRMPVSEVTDGMRVEPNHIYVIPRNTNMAIRQGVLRLLPREETRGQHRPIDYFLRSLAEEKSNRAIGVILSGTASDGTLGLEAIKAEGGITFAQDKKTAKYDGMPRSAIAAGCVDFELPPDRIAEELARLARHPHVATVEEARREERLPSYEELAAGGDAFSQILRLVRRLTGVDFSHYKPNTIQRRMTRRMALLKLDRLDAYADYLRDHKGEVENLFQDILIGVTSFFRDPEIYETLKEKIFPELVKHRVGDEPLRVWVVGCSSGEEAYSVAIAFLEFTGAMGEHVPIQIFATDINDKAIARARVGLYSQSLVSDVSPERLRRFFVKNDGGYQISKPVRDMCVFAQHNMMTDPPFSRMDLVSCRNLLIYLEVVLQKKVLPALHYSLKPTGFLLLGSSETVGPCANLFKLEDKKHKIYSKIPGPSHMQFKYVPGVEAVEKVEADRKAPRVAEEAAANSAAQREVDRITLQKYGPASVLTDENWEILLFRGATGVFLEAPAGRATHNLLRLAREGLLAPLRSALHQAKKHDRPVRQEGLSVKFDGQARDFDLEVVPIKIPTSDDRRFLVFFEPVTPVPEMKPTEAGKARKGRGARRGPSAKPSEARLQRELDSTREYLQSVIEQQEAYSEELQSANEEVQSSNEELQSINEELETAKEELQSSNEELTTINQELSDSNQEAMQINNDLVNLLSSVQMPIVMLGNDFRIRRFTPMAERLLNLVATDVGRPITDLKFNLDLPQLPELLTEVIETVSAKELEARDHKGRWHSLRIRPYKTIENKIEGVVIVMVDIDFLKRAEESLRDNQARLMGLIESAMDAIITVNAEQRIVIFNAAAEKMFGYTAAETLGQPLALLIPERFRAAHEQHIRNFGETGETSRAMGALGAVSGVRRSGEEFPIEASISQTEIGGQKLFTVILRDVTERKRAVEALRESEEQARRTLAEQMVAGVYECDAAGKFTLVNQRYCDIVGRAKEELVGMRVEDITRSEDWPRNAELYRRLYENGESFFIEKSYRRNGGSEVWVNSHISPIRNARGEIEGSVAVVVDVTDRRRAEQELAAAKDRLAADYEQAEAATRAKDEFLAVVSHELRSPLNSILGYTRLLRAGATDAEQTRQMAEVIERNGRMQLRLIEDLLDTARIISGKLELEVQPVDLVAVVAAALDVVRPSAEAKGVSLISDLSPLAGQITGDPDRLQQVVWNLLSNAIKFTPENGRVEITLKRMAPNVAIVVRDTGKGIEPEFLPHIFEHFRQADMSSARRAGGLGLGLSLTKHLVELHGGTIEAESAGAGRGATFTVRLPVRAIYTAPPEERKAVAAILPAGVKSLAGVRALIVDDEEEARAMLTMTLQNYGAEARAAASGKEALELLARQTPDERFDVLICDIGMPDEDGYTVMRKVREAPEDKGGRIPAVALTAYGRAEDRLRALAAGFQMHVTKPVDPDELAVVILSLIRWGGAR